MKTIRAGSERGALRVGVVTLCPPLRRDIRPALPPAGAVAPRALPPPRSLSLPPPAGPSEQGLARAAGSRGPLRGWAAQPLQPVGGASGRVCGAPEE